MTYPNSGPFKSPATDEEKRTEKGDKLQVITDIFNALYQMSPPLPPEQQGEPPHPKRHAEGNLWGTNPFPIGSMIIVLLFFIVSGWVALDVFTGLSWPLNLWFTTECTLRHNAPNLLGFCLKSHP
jgi:hypothetical protein